jgi:hypothetical protein
MRIRGVRAGVCVVRVEARTGGVLVTVTVDGDVGRNLRAVPRERARRFADSDGALAAVEQFLRSFTDTGPPPAGRE